MSEFEDKLNGLLSDPKQMDMLAQMAKSLMGGQDTGGGEKTASQPAAQPAAFSPAGGFDPEMLGSISRFMSRAGGEKNDKKAILEALKPYLAEKRRNKMDRAIKIARMAKLANIALKEYGGGENGL